MSDLQWGILIGIAATYLCSTGGFILFVLWARNNCPVMDEEYPPAWTGQPEGEALYRRFIQ